MLRGKKHNISCSLSLWCGIINSTFELPTMLLCCTGQYLEQWDSFDCKTDCIQRRGYMANCHSCHLMDWCMACLLLGWMKLRSPVLWEPCWVPAWEVCALRVWSWKRAVVKYKWVWELPTHWRLCLDFMGAKEGELLPLSGHVHTPGRWVVRVAGSWDQPDLLSPLSAFPLCYFNNQLHW